MDNLKKKIEEFEQKNKKKEIKKTSLPFNIAIEIVSGILTGIFLGLLLDNYFYTKPIFIIICIIVSLIATFKRIYNLYG